MISDTENSQFVDRFHRDGFLLIEGALNPEQCTALRSEVDLAMR